MERDDKHLDGAGLGDVWAKIKAGFLSLSGGTIGSGSTTIAPLVINGGSSYSGIEYVKYDGTSWGKIGCSASGPFFHDGSAYRTIYHSNNSNKNDVPWTCQTLTVASNATISGGASISGNVGIGTTATEKLDVNGNIKGTNIYASGGVAAYGIADLSM